MIGICVTIILCVAIVCLTIITMYAIKVNKERDSNKNMELVGRRTEYNRYPWTESEFDNEELEELQKYKEENQNAD